MFTLSGLIALAPSGGAIEIMSGSNPKSFIDFKGSVNGAADYRGRIIHDDAFGFKFMVDAKTEVSLSILNNGTLYVGAPDATTLTNREDILWR